MKKLLTYIIVFITTAIMFFNCGRQNEYKGHDSTPIKYFDQCQSYDFEIYSLPYDELFNTGFSLSYVTDTSFHRDKNGVMLFEWEGQYYYHPVVMCSKALHLIDAFYQTGDSAYLELAEKYADRLIIEAKEFDGALYYPYNFDYRVHRRDDALLSAPWYSGLAQGLVLSVFVRLFNITRDSTYLDFAGKTLESFRRSRGEREPWTVFVDPRGCFWVEEYPLAEPSMTLNGFITAIYGIYEYYQLTGEISVGNILKSCFNTAKNYIPLFRRKGKPSLYDLRFRHFAADYHGLHITQLRYLEKMTRDPFFGSWADSLQSDYDG